MTLEMEQGNLLNIRNVKDRIYDRLIPDMVDSQLHQDHQHQHLVLGQESGSGEIGREQR